MRRIISVLNDNLDTLAEEAAEEFYTQVNVLLEKQDKVIVSLCGGRSVQDFYKQLLKQSNSFEHWDKIHFIITDERLVPPDNEESNYKLVKELLLDGLTSLPKENIHRFKGENENVQSELQEYDAVLQQLGGKIDILMLGVGEDGHIGALFPNHTCLDEVETKYLSLNDSPKPPSGRMTVSPEHVLQSTIPFIFFIGEGKQKAYNNFLDDNVDYRQVPCRLALEGEHSDMVYVVSNLN